MDNDYTALLHDFLADETVRGARARWASSLKYRVPKLFTYLEEQDLGIRQVKVADAQGYQGWLLETGRLDGGKYSAVSITTYVTAATCFYAWLKRCGIVSVNPFSDVRKLRAGRKLPRHILKEKEMNRFLLELSPFDNAADGLTNRITRYRVHVVAELLYSTGLRISEAAALRVGDIDFSRGIVQVVDGKGGKDRIAFLNDYAKEVLRLYVTHLRDVIFNSWNRANDTLFGVQWGWFEKIVNRELKAVSNRLGYGNVTSHSFRHAVGFHLLRAGCDIRRIQAILGHERLKTTEVYTKVEKEDLREVLDTFHPRQFKGADNETTDVPAREADV
jgi:integrase/recombinase XerD